MSDHAAPTMSSQFSIFLINKPGVLARICQQIAEDKVNIVAMSMMDSTEHGVLRIVAEKPEQIRESLQALNVPMTEAPVLLATLPNRPGALADVMERLASARISINYAYVTSGARGGKTVGIFSVSNTSKASQVLSERKPKRKQPARMKRRSS
jgi:hypothetical protein